VDWDEQKKSKEQHLEVEPGIRNQKKGLRRKMKDSNGEGLWGKGQRAGLQN